MKKHIFKSITLTLTMTILLNSVQTLCMHNNLKETIIEIKEPKQLKDTSAKNTNFFDKIPYDAIHQIVKFLDNKSLVNFKYLNKKLEALAKDRHLKLNLKDLKLDKKTKTKKEIQNLLLNIKSQIEVNGSVILESQTASGDTKHKRFYNYNFKKYLYKILKKEIRYYKNLYQIDKTKTKIISKLIGGIQITFTIAILLLYIDLLVIWGLLRHLNPLSTLNIISFWISMITANIPCVSLSISIACYYSILFKKYKILNKNNPESFSIFCMNTMCLPKLFEDLVQKTKDKQINSLCTKEELKKIIFNKKKTPQKQNSIQEFEKEMERLFENIRSNEIVIEIADI